MSKYKLHIAGFRSPAERNFIKALIALAEQYATLPEAHKAVSAMADVPPNMYIFSSPRALMVYDRILDSILEIERDDLPALPTISSHEGQYPRLQSYTNTIHAEFINLAYSVAQRHQYLSEALKAIYCLNVPAGVLIKPGQVAIYFETMEEDGPVASIFFDPQIN